MERFDLNRLFNCLRSTLLAAGCTLILASNVASAHEVIPSIVDFQVVDDKLEISLKASLEAFVAEVNLSDAVDINATPQAQRYDELRAFDAERLTKEFQSYWPTFSDLFRIVGNEQTIDVTLHSVAVPSEIPVELVRTSTLTISAPLPNEIEAVRFVTDAKIGDFIIRQNGVDAPFSGFISAGTSSPLIDLQRESWWQSLLSFIGFQ